MNILRQIVIIFGICLFSETLSSILPVPIPGGLIGMLFLFFLLLSGVLKERHVKELADFLVKRMAFFFVPIGVAVITELMKYEEKLIGIVVVVLSISVLAFVLSYLATVLVIRLKNGFMKGNEHGIDME